jgi:(1->4)-alpha-D-glucan 1-alpha-D-glucosylmutase
MSTPSATYRLQFRDGMTFEKAAGLAPYLAQLGVSHLYASPIFEAEPGSTHGYDVIDNRMIDPSLGGDEGFERMVAALRAEGIQIILDFVPNHMSASTRNPYWRHVLEWGEKSECAQFFDIDWSAPKLLVPALGTSYGHALESGAFGLSFDERDGGLTFTYGALKLPLTPTSYAQVLTRAQGEEFSEWARRFAVTTAETSTELKAELAEAARDPDVRKAIAQALDDVVEDVGALHELHEMQCWRLTHWRAARERLTYRRFFEIADLVGLKVERPRVFDELHARLSDLVLTGSVAGLRLDHIDGLADPKGYLERLQKTLGEVEPLYLVVEKILGPDEQLRSDWPVAGTTGYEFIRAIADLLVDPEGAAPMTRAYNAFLGEDVDYATLALAAKRSILARNLAGELEHLKDLVGALAERHLATRDLGTDTLRRAIIELAAALPFYRTYVDVTGAYDEDRAILDAAAAQAKAARQVEDEEAIDFLKRVLLLDFELPEDQGSALEFTTRFQQTTGPVMAKALEDTTFYRYNRLIALNEVGGEPDRFGMPVSAFHDSMSERLRRQPGGLSTTATHDTKRGEDSRARLYVLSEMPDVWVEAVGRWAGLNAGLHREAGEMSAPEPEIEWMFYQALAGAWPATLSCEDADGLGELAERMAQFMLKAVREAKAHTSWTGQAADYEAAIEAFARGALDPAQSRAFLDDFHTVCQPVFVAGALNGLAQTAIKLTAPGVPDIYQGTELWDLSLVDPDNRRPVDFEERSTRLRALADAEPEALLSEWRTGAPKLRLVQAGLQLRAARPGLFADGAYVPLKVEGAAAANLVAFARTDDDGAVVTVAPRQGLGSLAGQSVPLVPAAHWRDTVVELPATLARHAWVDAVTTERHAPRAKLSVATLLRRYPVAVLAKERQV